MLRDLAGDPLFPALKSSLDSINATPVLAPVKRIVITLKGFYFLVGAADEDNKPIVYVGEAEEFPSLLRRQNRQKDF